MRKINVVIADDELPARGELSYELSIFPEVKLLGSFPDGRQLIEYLQLHPNIDLAFIDIEMPIMNGLEDAKRINELNINTRFVFATGYSQFAVQAFELEAYDYILKPYDSQRIKKIIKRLIDSLEEKNENLVHYDINFINQKFLLRGKDRSILINPLKDLILVSSEKTSGTLFYTTLGIVESKLILREAEDQLKTYNFFRTNKGYIVNLSKIQEIIPQDNSTLLLTMEHYPKIQVPVSRHYIKAFRAAIHK